MSVSGYTCPHAQHTAHYEAPMPTMLTGRWLVLATRRCACCDSRLQGGLLQTAAPGRIGTKLEGFTHVCDSYATWCALAGVDPTDARGAKAGLPPVDGLNLWPYISGETDVYGNFDKILDRFDIVLDWFKRSREISSDDMIYFVPMPIGCVFAG